MPPEQNKNQNPTPARASAIRTMQSDAQEFLKTAKPSLMQIIGQRQEEFTPPEQRSRRARPLAILALALGVAALGVGIFLFLRAFSGTSPGISGEITQKLTPPQPFFATETSRTISVKARDRIEFLRLVADSMKEQEREGTVKRIVIKVQDGPHERFATLDDFFDLWRMTPPSTLGPQINPPLMAFIYYGKEGSRLGFMAPSRAPDRTLADMLSWEPGLFSVFTPFFFDEKINSGLTPFEDRTYRNIDWRYLKLSQERDLGIAYTLFPAGDFLIVTTSKNALETVINRLFDAR